MLLKREKWREKVSRGQWSWGWGQFGPWVSIEKVEMMGWGERKGKGR